jgi:hypothetical protein
MNTLLIIVVVFALCYFGGAKCPKVLKDNKEMLLGVLVGLALCSFMGVRLEGFDSQAECLAACGTNDRDMRMICNSDYFRAVTQDEDKNCSVRDRQGLIFLLNRARNEKGAIERERFNSTHPPSDGYGGRGR